MTLDNTQTFVCIYYQDLALLLEASYLLALKFAKAFSPYDRN